MWGSQQGTPTALHSVPKQPAQQLLLSAHDLLCANKPSRYAQADTLLFGRELLASPCKALACPWQKLELAGMRK